MGSGRLRQNDPTDLDADDEVDQDDLPGGITGMMTSGGPSDTSGTVEQAQEVPVDQWIDFFKDFTDRYIGKTVTLEEQDADSGEVRAIANGLPLVGVSPDFQDRSPDTNDEGEGTIQIILGDQASDHITHTVIEPTFVYRYQSDSGADEAVEIESATGPTTILRL